MFAPGVPEVMTDFASSNEQLASFVVSVYILGYAFGPLVIAPLSELYGRLPLYHAANLGFIILTVACAVSSDLNMLIAFRFLEGLFGSCPLTIGGGTIADMIIQEKRGGVMAIWALGPLMGPVIGPVAGGFLSQAKGWRWVFWVIAIAVRVPPSIHSRTASLTRSIGRRHIPLSRLLFARNLSADSPRAQSQETPHRNGKPKSQIKTGLSSLPQRALQGFPRPPRQDAVLLAHRPCTVHLHGRRLRLPLPPLHDPYRSLRRPIWLLFRHGGTDLLGYRYRMSRRCHRFRNCKRQDPEAHVRQGRDESRISLAADDTRLYVLPIFSRPKSIPWPPVSTYEDPLTLPSPPTAFFIPVGLFIYGWTAEKHVHWIAPIIGTSLVGIGLLATFMPIQTYLVDAFTIYAASALAANTVLRSLVGALLPLAGRKMYATLGLGWGNSLLAFIALAMCPIPWIFFRYGERIRKSPRFQLDL